MTEPPAKKNPEDRFFTEPPAPETPAWTREELEALWYRRRARHLLLALVPLYALSAGVCYALIDALAGGNPKVALAQLWTFLAFAPLHAAVWWWSGRALMPAVATAATLFALQEVVLAALDPLGLARGVFLKLAVVLVLVQAYRSARSAHAMGAPR